MAHALAAEQARQRHGGLPALNDFEGIIFAMLESPVLATGPPHVEGWTSACSTVESSDG